MANDLENYLAEVKERHGATGYVGGPECMDDEERRILAACIDDVESLVKIAEVFRVACVVLPGHTFAGIADGVRDGVRDVNRIAREAREKKT